MGGSSPACSWGFIAESKQNLGASKPEASGLGPAAVKETEGKLEGEEHLVDSVSECDGGESTQPAFHMLIIKDGSESSLETGEKAEPVKKEEGNGSYCMVQVAQSPTRPQLALDCQLNFTTMCGQLPPFFGDTGSVLSAPGDMFAQEPPNQPGCHKQAEKYYPDKIEKVTKKKKIVGSSKKAAKVVSGNLYSHVQFPDVDPNLSLSNATRRSTRCAIASTESQELHKGPAVQETGSAQDAVKERKGPPENPEVLPPVRKKTRTFYSTEQLEELEKMFQEDHYPDNEKRKEIAAVIGVTPQRIMVWFQNRRAKWRKMEKLTVKETKKCPALATTLSAPTGSDTYGSSLLPMPPLPNITHDQSAMLNMDTTAGTNPSMLSGQPAPFVSSTVSSVTGVVAPYETVQTKALSQGSFSSSRMECFPTILSPPPIRRASLPLSLTFNPNNHIVPLMLDTPKSECSPSSQKNSSREAFTYTFQSQGVNSPSSCSYLDQMEPRANLETPYYQYSNQSGNYPLPQYPQQHQVSQYHRFPVHLASDMLPSVRLMSATPSESNPAFFSLGGSGGIVTYGAAGVPRGYLQNHVGEQFLLQQPGGSSGGISAYQAISWNDYYMQGPPFSSQLCSQVPFSGMAGGTYATEQVPYTQTSSMQPAPCFLQMPNGASGSVVFTGKEKAPATPDQTSYQNHPAEPELPTPAEREDSNIDSSSSSPKQEECAPDVKDETKD
ncbi:homeobox protein NOBOX [Alligator sinensis]|uniref:Homeobox protein NOBOX n=1 Tax=Alligator sinensis TaxID=38654 RepID=A0A1U7SE10_ALLSI|nr:homeobox protein NOBOX [Alligator sinensis]